MALELGRLCKFYAAAAGDTPVEIARIKDVKLNKSAEVADSTSRSNDGWKGKRQGLKEWLADFEGLKDAEDTAMGTISTAFNNGTLLDVEFYKDDGDGTVTKTETGSCIVTDFSRSEPLSGIVSISIKLEGDGPLVVI